MKGINEGLSLMSVGEFIDLVRHIFWCADQTVNATDCARFKEAVIEALAREVKLDRGDLRAAWLGVAAGNLQLDIADQRAPSQAARGRTRVSKAKEPKQK